MRDIVHVKEGQETPFIEQAIALGYSEIVLIYRRKVEKVPKTEKIVIRTGLLGKKGCDENIVLGTSLSNIPKGATMLINNEFDEEKDFVHQRRSGINHVWMKECKKQGITLLFNLSRLQETPIEQVSIIIGRMKQNAKLAKKYGVNFDLVSFSDEVLKMRHSKDVAAMKRFLFA